MPKGRLPELEEKFERLTVKELVTKEDGKTYAKCLCACGNWIETRATSLIQKHTKSCGCIKNEKASERTKQRNYKHGQGNFRNRLYRIWAAMKNRCSNTNNKFYKNYGGRGIKVCEDWLCFIPFYHWATENNYQDGLSLDRIDNNGNYEPSNCRWATTKEQARNRNNNRLDTVYIVAFGEKKNLSNWLLDERCKVKNGTTICYRIGAGWTPEEAISKISERGK